MSTTTDDILVALDAGLLARIKESAAAREELRSSVAPEEAQRGDVLALAALRLALAEARETGYRDAWRDAMRIGGLAIRVTQ